MTFDTPRVRAPFFLPQGFARTRADSRRTREEAMEGAISRNPVLELILHLGFGQLKDGLYEDAVATFSAARLMDLNDDRPLRGRAAAYERMKMQGPAARDFEAADALRRA